MIEQEDNDKQQNFIPNIVRTLNIFEYLAMEKLEASIPELVEHFDIPRNSVFRIIKTLEFYGYLEETARKYRVTPRLLYMGYGGLQSNGIIENSLDIMYKLRDIVGESVMIGTVSGNQIVLLELVPSCHFVKFTSEIGSKINMHASAPGKAILAYLPEKEQDGVLSQITFTRYNDATIPSKSELRDELALVFEKGFAMDAGEELREVHCVGAPIFDYRHYPVGSIWISGPAGRLDLETRSRAGIEVAHHGLMISRRFGYAPN
ncbi:MAG: IclR family transcriptional regulator [Spirochaetales bacterium]|nr:IclR family transcriptional regulator [Spirochaetales bacterium]